ncbi:Dedicator Of Cytokinesis Protein 4 [Manis pentadactyla]|nr:Dedicator Of Cytokinesis Protein 4 [Manis pentadactyla]
MAFASWTLELGWLLNWGALIFLQLGTPLARPPSPTCAQTRQPDSRTCRPATPPSTLSGFLILLNAWALWALRNQVSRWHAQCAPSSRNAPGQKLRAEPVLWEPRLRGDHLPLEVATQLAGTLAATHASWGSVAPSSWGPRSHNKCSRSHSRSNRPGVLVPPGPSAPVTHASPGKDRAPLDDSPAAGEGPPGPGSSDRLRQQPEPSEPGESEVPTEPLRLHWAVPPVLPLHRRRGLQPARRLQRGGPDREPVLKTGQREGQGLPLCPPRWPPARPPAPKAAVAGAGVCNLQPCLAPAHNPHPRWGHPLLPELYTSPRAEATDSAPAPRPQPQDIPAAFAPEAHAGSLPGPGFAQAWTPTSSGTNMVLAGHSCLQSKQALVGGSLFCLSTEGSQKCRIVCR